jgi:hypothetical protein
MAIGHDPGLSALDVLVTSTRVVAVLSIATADLASLADLDVDPHGSRAGDSAAAATERRLGSFALRALTIRLDGRVLQGSLDHVAIDDRGGQVQLRYASAPGTTIGVSSEVSRRLARGHRELVSIRTGDGSVLSERLLDASSGASVADLPALSSAADVPAPPAIRWRRYALLGCGLVAGLVSLWVRPSTRGFTAAAGSG